MSILRSSQVIRMSSQRQLEPPCKHGSMPRKNKSRCPPFFLKSSTRAILQLAVRSRSVTKPKPKLVRSQTSQVGCFIPRICAHRGVNISVAHLPPWFICNAKSRSFFTVILRNSLTTVLIFITLTPEAHTPTHDTPIRVKMPLVSHIHSVIHVRAVNHVNGPKLRTLNPFFCFFPSEEHLTSMVACTWEKRNHRFIRLAAR